MPYLGISCQQFKEARSMIRRSLVGPALNGRVKRSLDCVGSVNRARSAYKRLLWDIKFAVSITPLPRSNVLAGKLQPLLIALCASLGKRCLKESPNWIVRLVRSTQRAPQCCLKDKTAKTFSTLPSLITFFSHSHSAARLYAHSPRFQHQWRNEEVLTVLFIVFGEE